MGECLDVGDFSVGKYDSWAEHLLNELRILINNCYFQVRKFRKRFFGSVKRFLEKYFYPEKPLAPTFSWQWLKKMKFNFSFIYDEYKNWKKNSKSSENDLFLKCLTYFQNNNSLSLKP